MKANCDKAMEFGEKLKKKLPKFDIYVPAEKDEFIALAYQKGYITDTQILDIDCMILNRCEILAIYAPDKHISLGMQIEKDFARKNNIPIYNVEFYKGRVDWAALQHWFEM